MYACITQLVRIYPALVQMFFEESMFIYQSLTDVTTVLSIKAFDFAVYKLNVVIKLCQVRDVQYDQVVDLMRPLRACKLHSRGSTSTLLPDSNTKPGQTS